MTDHSALFEELLAVVEADSRFQKTHAERYLMGFEPEIKSRFQRIWEHHGLPILRLEVRKKQPQRPGDTLPGDFDLLEASSIPKTSFSPVR